VISRQTAAVFLLFFATLCAIVFAAGALAVPAGEELTYEEGPKPVIFSGKVHADHGLKCNDCHTAIFKREKGNAKIAFEDHAGGKYCFACHDGNKSFASKGNCAKCHGNQAATATPAAAAAPPEPAKGPTPVAAAAKPEPATAPASAAPKVAPTAADKEAAVEKLRQTAFSKDGLNTCIGCHDEDNEYPVFPLFKTKHGVVADARTPLADKGCESCHGPGSVHIKAKKSEKRGGSIVNFGKKAWTPVKEQNEKCLACHQTHTRIEWKGSTHEFNQLACASCHSVHVAKDPVLDRAEQSRVCYTCHKNQQAKFLQASRHPVREAQMSCSECHNVHGEDGTGLLVKTTSRDKCVACHAEKRGPLLWEHAPVAEDCTLCHDPHGSNQPALLKKRVPQLCQQCHSPSGHPSVRYDGAKLPSAYMQAKGCLNCHSAVHGSNHPSGSTLLR
jgi:DmsE family decaheme c-type cytochrome